MTIDKEKLKALALVATKSKWTTDDLNEVMSAESDQLNSGYIIADCQGPDRWRNAQFIAASDPETVLTLLAEIDQLNAESEALRKDAERYRFVRSPIGTASPLAIWSEGKMPIFSSIADAVVDEFMAKERGQ